MEEGKTILEIRTGDKPPVEVIKLDEFMEQHKKIYAIPLLHEGCILVKKLGYLKRATISEGYEELFEKEGLNPEQAKALFERYKALHSALKKDSENKQIKEQFALISEEVKKHRELLGASSREMFIGYVRAVIHEPKELKDPIACRAWLNEMEEDEYIHFTEMMEEFMGGLKKNSPMS